MRPDRERGTRRCLCERGSSPTRGRGGLACSRSAGGRAEAHVIFRQYALGVLSQLSFLVGDEITRGPVVVDPHRDVSLYLDKPPRTGCGVNAVPSTASTQRRACRGPG